jgi:uncharacterized protein YdeI (BOF family)
MKKLVSSLWYGIALALTLAVLASGVHAQQTTPPADQPSQAQPGQPPSAQQSPDAQAPSQSAGSTQTFSGTVVKAGDKYVLQDTASGTSYDVDRQDLLKKYEGQKVRIKGTLDASGKMIQVK